MPNHQGVEIIQASRCETSIYWMWSVIIKLHTHSVLKEEDVNIYSPLTPGISIQVIRLQLVKDVQNVVI